MTIRLIEVCKIMKIKGSVPIRVHFCLVMKEKNVLSVAGVNILLAYCYCTILIVLQLSYRWRSNAHAVFRQRCALYHGMTFGCG
jgi:hypothetical protein